MRQGSISVKETTKLRADDLLDRKICPVATFSWSSAIIELLCIPISGWQPSLGALVERGWSSPAPSSSPPNLRLDCALKFARPTPAAQAASHPKGLKKPKTDYRGGQGGGFLQVESNIDIDLFKTLLFLLSGFIC